MQVISFGKIQIRAVIFVALSLVLLLSILNIGSIHRQLDAWKLLPQPERLTELYYANHTKLPTNYTAGVPQQFSFITHNLEYQDTGYSYKVVQASEDGKITQPIASGTFKLTPDTIGTTPVSFTPVDMGNKSLIITTLTNTRTGSVQSVHYWVVNTSQATTTTEGGA
jgi:hypothetical protein